MNNWPSVTFLVSSFDVSWPKCRPSLWSVRLAISTCVGVTSSISPQVRLGLGLVRVVTEPNPN